MAYSACAGKDVHILGFTKRRYRIWVGPIYLLDAMRTNTDSTSIGNEILVVWHIGTLTHCGRVTQICVFNTVKLGTSASSP